MAKEPFSFEELLRNAVARGEIDPELVSARDSNLRKADDPLANHRIALAKEVCATLHAYGKEHSLSAVDGAHVLAVLLGAAIKELAPHPLMGFVVLQTYLQTVVDAYRNGGENNG